MSIVKLNQEDLDTLDTYLEVGSDKSIKIGARCECRLCELARDIVGTKNVITGDSALKVIKLIDKMHKRFGQCDINLLKSLFDDSIKNTATSSE